MNGTQSQNVLGWIKHKKKIEMMVFATKELKSCQSLALTPNYTICLIYWFGKWKDIAFYIIAKR